MSSGYAHSPSPDDEFACSERRCIRRTYAPGMNRRFIRRNSDIEQMLFAAVRLIRLVAPQMKERRWGRVVHISSIMAQVSKEKRNVYSATKAALIGMARASALDLGPFGVTVNCIAPGPFMTDMPMSVLSDAEKQAFADRTALGRWAQPAELVGPVLMLCSEAGSYITGQTLFVDGGYLAR